MVQRVSKDGAVYHEPPYTNEEQLEIVNRANAGVVSFSKRTLRPADRPASRK